MPAMLCAVMFLQLTAVLFLELKWLSGIMRLLRLDNKPGQELLAQRTRAWHSLRLHASWFFLLKAKQSSSTGWEQSETGYNCPRKHVNTPWSSVVLYSWHAMDSFIHA